MAKGPERAFYSCATKPAESQPKQLFHILNPLIYQDCAVQTLYQGTDHFEVSSVYHADKITIYMELLGGK